MLSPLWSRVRQRLCSFPGMEPAAQITTSSGSEHELTLLITPLWAGNGPCYREYSRPTSASHSAFALPLSSLYAASTS